MEGSSRVSRSASMVMVDWTGQPRKLDLRLCEPFWIRQDVLPEALAPGDRRALRTPLEENLWVRVGRGEVVVEAAVQARYPARQTRAPQPPADQTPMAQRPAPLQSAHQTPEIQIAPETPVPDGPIVQARPPQRSARRRRAGQFRRQVVIQEFVERARNAVMELEHNGGRLLVALMDGVGEVAALEGYNEALSAVSAVMTSLPSNVASSEYAEQYEELIQRWELAGRGWS